MDSNQSFINYDKNLYKSQLDKITENYNNAKSNKKIKKTYINIDSKDRATTYSFQYFSSTTLTANPILFSGTNKIKIYHPNNNLDVTKSYDVILSSVVGDTINNVVQQTTCNYPLNLINFEIKLT